MEVVLGRRINPVCDSDVSSRSVVQLPRLLPPRLALLSFSEFMQNRFSRATVTTNEIREPLISDEWA